MSMDMPKIKVVETSRLMKYGEGVDPSTGTPFEVLENSRELSPEEAALYIKVLQEAGKLHFTKEGINNATN